MIPSTASFSDTWQPFLRLAEINWPDRPWPLVLIADGNAERLPEAVGFDSIRADGQDLGWSRNLARGLAASNAADIVLMVLDDFWPSNPWDTEAIKSATRWMQRRPHVGCFRLNPCPGPQRETSLNGGDLAGQRASYPFGQVHKGEPYRTSTQPALWRVGFLRRILGTCERTGAWGFENPDGGGPTASWSDEVWSVLRSAPQPWPTETVNTAITRGAWNSFALEMLDRHGIERPKIRRPIVGSDRA